MQTTNNNLPVYDAMQDYTEQDVAKRKYNSLWENKYREEKLNSICWKEVENFLWGVAASCTLVLMAFAYVILAGI